MLEILDFLLDIRVMIVILITWFIGLTLGIVLGGLVANNSKVETEESTDQPEITSLRPSGEPSRPSLPSSRKTMWD
jgi:hypothetical protein